MQDVFKHLLNDFRVNVVASESTSCTLGRNQVFACRKATETTKALANGDEKHTQHTRRTIFTYLFDPSNFYLFPS